MSMTNGKIPQDTHEEAHATFVTWLDAYVTDELEEHEKEQLEQHIKQCAACQQWLLDILRLRTLLKAQGTSMRNVINEHADQAASFSQSVLTAIAHNRNHATAQEAWEQPVAKEQRVAPVAEPKNAVKRPYLRAISVLAVALCLSLLLVALLPQLTRLTTPHSIGIDPPNFWQLDQKQTVMRNGSDIFAVKNVEVTAREFRFFYAFKSAQAVEVPHLEVISLLPSQPGSTLHLATHIQSFGKVGTFGVGVIQIAYLDRVGQTIVIQGTSASKTSSWHLNLLKQFYEEPLMIGGFYVDQNNLPDVTWTSGYGGKVEVAYFQATTSDRGKMERLYLSIGDSIKVITRAEFLQLEGPPPKEPPCSKCLKPLSVKEISATVAAGATATAGAANKK